MVKAMCGALDLEVEGQRKRGRPKRTWKKQVEEESVKIGLRRCTLPIKVECWHKSDCSWVEANLATFNCWGYNQILSIGVSTKVEFQSYLQWSVVNCIQGVQDNFYILILCHFFQFG